MSVDSVWLALGSATAATHVSGHGIKTTGFPSLNRGVRLVYLTADDVNARKHVAARSIQYTDEYSELYNTERGPRRLHLDSFLSGYRYKSLERDPPTYLACYDLKRLSSLDEPRYTALGDDPSSRERDLLDHKLSLLDRRVYSDISIRGRSDGPAPIIMTVAFLVKNEHVEEVHNWYEEEHTGDLMKIPGWIRSRRFQLVEADDEKEGYTELLAVHEYEKENGLDGPEHNYAKSRPWRNRVLGLVDRRVNQRFEFLHELDAADYQKPHVVINGTVASQSVKTGATSWQIDGSTDPNAPVLVFSNSLLTDLHLWDKCLKELMMLYPQFRFLRYNTRGFESGTHDPVDIDTLTDDLALMLDEVGVKKCFAVIGVSLGGITALNFAIRYPSRLERFIACDCNCAASGKNTQAWKDRVALANSEGGWDKLAAETVNRWFTPASVQARTFGVKAVKEMISSASKSGFESCVNALCTVDLSEKIKSISVPGMCVVGAKDGILPAVMASFAKDIPECAVVEIPNAGHLPMVESVQTFVQAILPIFELHLAG